MDKTNFQNAGLIAESTHQSSKDTLIYGGEITSYSGSVSNPTLTLSLSDTVTKMFNRNGLLLTSSTSYIKELKGMIFRWVIQTPELITFGVLQPKYGDLLMSNGTSWILFSTTVSFQTQTVRLTANGWSEQKTQTVSVTGLRDNNNIMISIPPAYIEIAAVSQIYCAAHFGGNVLRFKCIGDVPSDNVDVDVMILS